MFTHGLIDESKNNGGLVLSVEQKQKIIELVEQKEVEQNDIDYFELKKGLLPRLQKSLDDNESLKFSVLEYTFILEAVAGDSDLYAYISHNARF